MSLNRASEPSRREFVKSLAMSTLGVSLGGSQAFAMPQAPASAGMAQSVIYIYLGGGISHLDSFDPKTNREVMGSTKILNTNVDGLSLGHTFTGLGKHADKLALVRSLSTNQGAHEQGNYYMHASYRQIASIRHPSMGSWIHKLNGHHHPSLPASVHIGGGRSLGQGFLSSKYQPLVIGNPNDGLKNSKHKWSSQKEFEEQRKLAQLFDEKFHTDHKSPAVDAYVDVYEAAMDLMKSKDLQAFNLRAENQTIRNAYGSNNFSQGVLLARRLVEHGVRFVEVQMGGWDTHDNHFSRFEGQSQILDSTVSTLLTDLQQRGMLEQTLVVIATEFGRTPIINQNGGRDHHPKAFSSVLAGGGIKGGSVYGRTDEQGINVVENRVDVTDFNATIGYAMGLPLDKIVHSPSGRPFQFAHKGKPIVELFG